MGTLQDTSMRREIIQNFLNLPGIVGVALMGGTSTPYFRGFAAENQPELSLPQQLTIAQHIQQVLETIPEGFNSFEFQFEGYRAYLHKLNRGTTLLVLTLNQLARLTYTQAVRRLLIELQIDQSDPISEFRSLTLDMLPARPAHPLAPPPEVAAIPSEQPPPANPSRLEQNNAQPSLSQQQVSPLPERANPAASPPPQAANGTHHSGQRFSFTPLPAPEAETYQQPGIDQQDAAPDALPPSSQPPSAARAAAVAPPDGSADAAQLERPAQTPEPESEPEPTLPKPAGAVAANPPRQSEVSSDGFEQVAKVEQLAAQSASLKDVLAAMNHLSQFTSQYLGTLVVSNYWKATRPDEDWLSHFQIERSAQMTFAVRIPSQPLPILTSSQHQCLKKWVAAFLERCSKVMRNFGKIVRQALTPQELALLFD